MHHRGSKKFLFFAPRKSVILSKTEQKVTMLPKRNFLTNNKQTHNFAAVFRVIGTHGTPIRAVAQGDSLNREPTLRKPQKKTIRP